jgi:hypothetical protein
MTWEPGRERVQALIDAGEVDRVTPDLAIARRMLDDAARHLTTAAAAKRAGDLSGAYQLAYDALRKSAASLLEAQRAAGDQPGLAPRGPGGYHRSARCICERLAVVRQDPPCSEQFRIPLQHHPGSASDDVDDAVTVATQVHHAATTILDREMLTPW